MKQEELVKGLTYLGMAYGKEYSKMECEQHYDFLKDFDYTTFIKAIKKIIKTSSYLPKINDLIKTCEDEKNSTKNDILEYMNKSDYFETPKEYEKAYKWVKSNIIPQWFINDMKKYEIKMKTKQITN